MKPSYWICGGGSQINCKYWNNINRCSRNEKDVYTCHFFITFYECFDNEMDDGAGGY